MDATRFFSLREKRFFPLKRRHNDVTDRRVLPQKMRLSLPDLMMLSLNLYFTHSEVMADQSWTGQKSGPCGTSRASLDFC